MWILIIAATAFIYQPIAYPTQEACLHVLYYLRHQEEGRLITKPKRIMACVEVVKL